MKQSPRPVLTLASITLLSPLAAQSETIPTYFARSARDLSSARDARSSAAVDPSGGNRARLEAHAAALGVSPRHVALPVQWREVARIERRGYVLEKIVFESAPGLPVPALLYLPKEIRGRAPAVLNVHGHWKEAKCAPQVHSRCAFLAMRGFVCLSLDAIGAGERAYQGITYHGRQLGYQILPTGMTLAGLQVLDNRRAIDLLSNLPQVDPDRIGVTGASGGGNQTFHLAILDDRVKAAVAVCFFGSFEGYLHGAHCACELVPGALTRSEEGEAAGWVAPRALKILAAKEDGGAAFRIEDARRNAALAAVLYEKAGARGQFDFQEFEGGHDYSRAMREAMVAFFEERLKGQPHTARVEEPELDLLPPDELRVFTDGKLPDGAQYVPQVAARLARERVAEFQASGLSWRDPEGRQKLRVRLEREILGRPADEPDPRPDLRWDTTGNGQIDQVLILVGPVKQSLARQDRTAIAQLEPIGTGSTRWAGASAVSCDDYVLAQGSAVLGRPILGEWVAGARAATSEALARHPKARVALLGEGVMALVALIAGAIDERVSAVGCVDLLSLYEYPDRFDDRWPLSIFVPGILRCGDIAQIAGALEGRRLLIDSPRDGGKKTLDAAGMERFTRLAGGAWDGFSISMGEDAQRIVERLLSTKAKE